MGRRENYVEDYLRRKVTENGGMFRKVTYQGRSGAPDLWCFFPKGKLVIVESKASDGRLSKQQEAEIARLRHYGQTVLVAYSREDVDKIIDTYV